MSRHLFVVAAVLAVVPGGRAACQEAGNPDSFEVRIDIGAPAAEPAGQFMLMVSLRRAGRPVPGDSLNSACLDTLDTPPPVRDTAALRARLPELVRWQRFRALSEPLGDAMFLYAGLQKLRGLDAIVDRTEAESLRESLWRADPPVLVLACGPLRYLYVWLRGEAEPFSWIAMAPPG